MRNRIHISHNLPNTCKKIEDDNFGKWYLKLDNQDGITCHFFSKKDRLEGDEKFFQLLK